MRLNFFGQPIPRPWNTEEVEEALHEMLAGKDIINGMMSSEVATIHNCFQGRRLGGSCERGGRHRGADSLRAQCVGL